MWSFNEIAAIEPERAIRLQNAPAWDCVRLSVLQRLEAALTAGQVGWGLEQCSENSEWLRAVLQFNVGAELLDWFFNSHSGYRAQFRSDWRRGLLLSEALNTDIRLVLARLVPAQMGCRLLSPSFEDVGPTMTTRETLLASLEPGLSKLWACAIVIDRHGSMRRVPLGLTTPKLLMSNGAPWRAISQDDADAFLELKGAFLTDSGLYQPKSATVRAEALHETGEPGYMQRQNAAA